MVLKAIQQYYVAADLRVNNSRTAALIFSSIELIYRIHFCPFKRGEVKISFDALFIHFSMD